LGTTLILATGLIIQRSPDLFSVQVYAAPQGAILKHSAIQHHLATAIRQKPHQNSPVFALTSVLKLS
jgi:hypothetical protein